MKKSVITLKFQTKTPKSLCRNRFGFYLQIKENSGKGRGEQPGPLQSLRGQVYLGLKAFVEQVQQRVTDQSAVLAMPRSQRRSLACPLAEYQETFADTREAMATAYVTGD